MQVFDRFTTAVCFLYWCWFLVGLLWLVFKQNVFQQWFNLILSNDKVTVHGRSPDFKEFCMHLLMT